MAAPKNPRASARRQTTTAVAVAEEVEVEEVKSGPGIDEGIVLTTTLLLLAAVVLAYFAVGKYPV